MACGRPDCVFASSPFGMTSPLCADCEKPSAMPSSAAKSASALPTNRSIAETRTFKTRSRSALRMAALPHRCRRYEIYDRENPAARATPTSSFSIAIFTTNSSILESTIARPAFTRGFCSSSFPIPTSHICSTPIRRLARARKPEYPIEFLRNARACYLAISKMAGMNVIHAGTPEEVGDSVRRVLANKLGHSSQLARPRIAHWYVKVKLSKYVRIGVLLRVPIHLVIDSHAIPIARIIVRVGLIQGVRCSVEGDRLVEKFDCPRFARPPASNDSSRC